MNSNSSSNTLSSKSLSRTSAFLLLTTILTLTNLLTGNIAQAVSCNQWVARAISVQGLAEQRISKNDQQTWQAVKSGHTFCASDVLRVRANSRVALRLNNDTVVRLDEHTTITFSSLNPGAASALDLEEGIAHFISRVKRAFKVITPFVNAAIEGTEFVVATDSQQTAVTVFEGNVRTENDMGSILLTKGQSAITAKGQAPVLELRVKPRNAVQWALHYPVVIDQPLTDSEKTGNQSPATSALARSQLLFRQGDAYAALQLVEQLSAENLKPDAATFRAGLWLATGRIDKAQTDIDHALNIAGNHSEALALNSIIALMQNQLVQATSLAQQAIDSNSQNTSGYLALSYAQQAQFNLAGAQITLASAPESTRILSRRAELSLMLGDPDRAFMLAKQAINKNPGLSHSHSILGFVHLIRNEATGAKAAFDHAMSLDQTSPLPRLGLGLVAIRNGQIEAGRQEIEFAASLDPNNALIRSYLGKAYYEENRSKLATDQFDMAKTLDPLDPTPWFYSAINLQSESRPVAALQDIKQATALNDNRAVFRSRQQLDEDSAARNASVARIYRDLGFDQLAMQQAWRSLDANPASHSAHRFLADSYARLPRHEIARVSELLQSQLLQPLNSNPVQPQLAESNLGILEGIGPADASPAELNPLFTRNGLRYQIDTLLAGQNTRGGDLLVSGIHNNTAFSLGRFHYSSDGFRENNDLEHDIDSAFFQTQLSTSLSVQAEYRNQETENGDLLLYLDPENFKKFWRQNTDTNTKRLGLHYQPAPGHDIIASYIRRKMYYTRDDSEVLPGPPAVLGEATVTLNPKAKTNELQYQFHSTRATITAGLGKADIDEPYTERTVGTLLPPLPPTVVRDVTTNVDFDSDNKNAYVYSSLTPQPDLVLTLGMSWVSFQQGVREIDGFNPKLGITWQASSSTQIRAAAFSSLRRPLIAEQTIEPTQVAGFNQFFDDTDGTKSKRYGLALEHKISSEVSGGIEITRRTLEEPVTNIDFTTGAVTAGPVYPIEERMRRAYFYLILNDDWSLSGEYFFERIKDKSGNPLRLKTHRLPMSIQYHAKNRINAGLTASYYRQYSIISGNEGTDDFWIVDASTGYRLPKRAGLLTVGVKNLFDQDFSFYNLESTGSPRPLLFQPERSVFAALTLTF